MNQKPFSSNASLDLTQDCIPCIFKQSPNAKSICHYFYIAWQLHHSFKIGKLDLSRIEKLDQSYFQRTLSLYQKKFSDRFNIPIKIAELLTRMVFNVTMGKTTSYETLRIGHEILGTYAWLKNVFLAISTPDRSSTFIERHLSINPSTKVCAFLINEVVNSIESTQFPEDPVLIKTYRRSILDMALESEDKTDCIKKGHALALLHKTLMECSIDFTEFCELFDTLRRQTNPKRYLAIYSILAYATDPEKDFKTELLAKFLIVGYQVSKQKDIECWIGQVPQDRVHSTLTRLVTIFKKPR